LAVIPLDPNLIRRWAFHFIRLSAHFVVFLVYIPLMAPQSDVPTLSPNGCLGGLVMSILVLYLLLIGFEGHHFSQLYFMVSIFISCLAWLLYFIPVAKTHILLYESGNRGHWNVLAFDFFCRILCVSLFWYAVHYDPSGTSKPKWAEVLG
jgi:hypothetical protein